MKIKAVYYSSHNGLCLTAEDGQLLDANKEGDVIATVTYATEDLCDNKGKFFGKIKDVETFVVATIKEHFGDGVDVEFEENPIS